MKYKGPLIALFAFFLCLLVIYLIRIGLVSNNELVDTRWELDYFLVDGAESTEFVSGQWLQFEKSKFSGFDNCNQLSGQYETSLNNGFSFEMFAFTLQACRVVNIETGEESSIGDKEFREELIRVFFYEVRDGRLYLYNTADKQNGLVFSSIPISS